MSGTDGADDLRYAGKRSITIYGRKGNDTLQGGSGNDTLIGGAGNDVFLHSDGGDVFMGGDSTVRGGVPTFPLPAPEFDTVSYGNATGTVGAIVNLAKQTTNAGLAAGDLFISIEQIIGSSAGDSLTGDGTDNTFLGMSGNDTLNGAGGDDSLDGGRRADILDGGSGDDTLTGGSDGDLLMGGAGFNILSGDGGDDTLLGGEGQDTARGGEGNDRLDYSASTASGIYLYGDGGNDVILSGSAYRVEGGEGNDTITGSALSGRSLNGGYVLGGLGDDRVDYTAALYKNIIRGDEGSDTLLGGSGGDIISGGRIQLTPTLFIVVADLDNGDAADVIDGGGGNDRIYGNWGNDTITGSAGSDTVLGGQGSDLIDYSPATAAQILLGGSGGDTIKGGSGDDRIYGGSNPLYGSYHIAFDDKASQPNVGPEQADGNDVIDGGAGNDRIEGGAGNDTVTGGVGEDVVEGNEGNDLIDYSASTQRNDLDGGSGDDVIRGGSGVDYITAGEGIDVMTGGGGADGFKIGSKTLGTFITGKTTATVDVITDFQTGADFLLTGNPAGNDANYREFKDGRVTSAEMALMVYNNATNSNPTAGGPSYTFVAGATDGYLIVDQDGIATNGATGVLKLNGLESLSEFAATDILAAGSGA